MESDIVTGRHASVEHWDDVELDTGLRDCWARIDRLIADRLDGAVGDDWMRQAIRHQLGWAGDDFARLAPGDRSLAGGRLRP
ncbi:MAG TPA: hypothetical protein VHW26_03210 [Solirubrobacteraceae bacterium]|nr:hypothetical protein [Solirubrobacteraceae bacterium]